jgi:hypothetical protein
MENRLPPMASTQSLIIKGRSLKVTGLRYSNWWLTTRVPESSS